jgi:uncharacterized protein YjiS (DUF1127 family)
MQQCKGVYSNLNAAALFHRRNENNGTSKYVEREYDMNLFRNYRNWRRYRVTVNELSRLSNRELTDLGITRADIEHVATRGRR